MRIGRKIKKNIRYLLKKILPSSFFNLIIFFLIRKKFISSYNNDKLYSKNYIDKTNNINEYKISSQNYEDGIIKSLILKLKKKNKKFLEIGFDYYECNSLQLIKQRWSGIFIDYDKEKIENFNIIKDKFDFKKIKILNNKISPGNINSIYKKEFINTNIDFFSIDIDSLDFYVLRNIKFRPKIICLEFNPYLTHFGSIVVKYKKNNFNNSNYYYGASIQAYTKLLKQMNYKLVALDSNNVNAFFIDIKEFKIKFDEININKNKNLMIFLNKNKNIIKNIKIKKYLKY
jgi:hypothetical protein